MMNISHLNNGRVLRDSCFFSLSVLLLACVLLTPGVVAAAGMSGMDMSAQPATPQAKGYAVAAQVVALEGNKVVLSHQAIPALGWPAMTMPFVLATPGLAKGLTPGLKIEATVAPVANDSPQLLRWTARQ